MRLIVETIDKCDYLEVILTENDVQRLIKRGVCAEFTGTSLEKKYLNIFIRPEEVEEYYATPEGEVEESYQREYRHRNESRETSETGCSDQPKESGQI